MRRWLFLVACSGCGFSIQSATPEIDAPVEIDAPIVVPDAFTPPACLSNPAYQPGGPQAGHRYRVTAVAGTYDSVVEQCAADGAHLVAVDSVPENAFVATLNGGSDTYIGLDDLDLEGTFAWVSGGSSTFRMFDDGEPNNNGAEDCVYTKGDARWNDSECGDARRGVCECDPGYVAPPVAACRALAGGSLKDGRIYHLRTAAKNWVDAVADCASIGAYLAVPADVDENNQLDISFPADSWIGYSDRSVEGTFAWVNGAPVGYTRWGALQPNALVDEDCVGIAIAGGNWDDTNCGILRPYACECEPLTR